MDATRFFLLALVLSLASPANAQIRFTELQTYDLASTSLAQSGHYIGSHPAAVAWADESHVYLAGMNDGSASGVGIVRALVTNPQPSYLGVMGFIPGTPAGFGYTAISDMNPGIVVASYDAGVPDPRGLNAFWTFDHTPAWTLSTRGSSGVVQEMLPPPDLLGVSWLTYGSDRRATQQSAGTAPIYTFTDGLVVNPGGSAAWRDIAVDFAGDYAARRANDVILVDRTGPNSGVPRVLVDLPDADLPGQNVEFMDFGGAPLVLYNARASTAPGQTMFDVVRIASKTGTPVTIDWGTFAPPTAAGEYDFAFTQNTEMRVAVLDVLNRRLTIFRAETLPNSVPFCFGDGTGTACPCGNSGALGNGCANSVSAGGASLSSSGVASRSADTLVLHGSGMPNGGALYFQATDLQAKGAGVVFGDGLLCVSGNMVRLGVAMNSSGASQYPGPGGTPISSTLTLYFVNHYQVWYRNSEPFCTSATYNLSNALAVWWGP